MKEKHKMDIPRIIRNISGTLIVFICVVLIFVFGVMPLFKCSICPVVSKNAKSLYSEGSIVFLHEVDASKLKKNDVIVYYKGKSAIGVKILVNDKNSQKVQAMGNDDITTEIKYREISGKSVGFSIPMMGNYANWLVKGSGLKTSVIFNSVLLLIFSISAIMTREEQ